MSKSRSRSIWGIIIANGKSEQVSRDVKTAFLQMGNQPILAYSLSAFNECPEIEGVVVIADKDRLDSIVGMSRLYGYPKLKKLIAGVVNRCASIRSAVHAIADESPSMVVLHEASRPCVTPEMISQIIKSARRYGTCVAAENQSGMMAQVARGSEISKVLPGKELWDLQTPIAIRSESIHRIVGSPNSKVKPPAMDDETLSERLYRGSRMVRFDQPNPQIVTSTDIRLVSALLHV